MTCPYCHLYHDIKQACEVCGANVPKDTTLDQPLTPRKQLVPFALAKPKTNTRLASILKTLRKASMTTDSQIADGLRTGQVSQAISWQLQYEYVIDYLVDKGYDVASYRYRIVTGSAATEYGQQAA